MVDEDSSSVDDMRISEVVERSEMKNAPAV